MNTVKMGGRMTEEGNDNSLSLRESEDRQLDEQTKKKSKTKRQT